MFTGIIEATGEVLGMQSQGGDQRLHIGTGQLDMHDVALGDSIAVSGVCLTVVEYSADAFYADVSNETLACTILGELQPGARVNLEKALLPTTRLGGHLVSGHVDGVGEIVAIEQDARSWRFSIKAPRAIARYIAAKGSICVDGISLTVNHVDSDVFGLNIVPHTLQETNLDDARVGRRVNLEVDIIARYLERLLSAPDTADETSEGITPFLLAKAGFVPKRG